MSFKVGERIAVNNMFAKPTQAGECPEVLCDVTAVGKHHLLAKLISVTQGATFAVKDDGTHLLSTAEKLPKGAQALAIGDVTALACCDIHPVREVKKS